MGKIDEMLLSTNLDNVDDSDIAEIADKMAELAETDLSYPFVMFSKALLESGIGDEGIEKVVTALKARIRAYENNEGI